MRKPSFRHGFLVIEAISALGGLAITVITLLHLVRAAQALASLSGSAQIVHAELPAQPLTYVVCSRQQALILPAHSCVYADTVWRSDADGGGLYSDRGSSL